MSITQLNPPLWLQTPKGEGLAHFIVDYGAEHDLLWVVFDDKTGEIWAWNNAEVRASANRSMLAPRTPQPRDLAPREAGLGALRNIVGGARVVEPSDG